MIWRLAGYEFLVTLLPGSGIYLLLDNLLTPPSDLSRTLLAVSATTIAVFFAAVAFIGQFSEPIAKSFIDAAGLDKEELRKRGKLLLAPVVFPRTMTRVVLRALILLGVTLALSAVFYFGSGLPGVYFAATAFLLFSMNMIYLLVAVLRRILKQMADLEGLVEEGSK